MRIIAEIIEFQKKNTLFLRFPASAGNSATHFQNSLLPLSTPEHCCAFFRFHFIFVRIVFIIHPDFQRKNMSGGFVNST